MRELEDKRPMTLLRRLGRVKVSTYTVIFAVWAGIVIGVARYLVEGEPVWAVVLVAFFPAILMFAILMTLDWRGHFDT